MNNTTLLSYRLANLQLARTKFKKPEQLLQWMGGMQAQDYNHSKWTLGVRIPGSTDTGMEKALNDKKIVRTWLMRNTLHIAAAQDIHWLLELLAPRQIKTAATRYRQLELDAAVFKKTNTLLTRSLQLDGQLTRAEITALLEKAGIKATGIRLAHILQRAVLDKLIHQGPKKGSEPTFILMELPGKKFTQEEALAELALRYFQSHGPATLADFTWYSGLPALDAKKALHIISGKLKSMVANDHTYWLSDKMPEVKPSSEDVYLLPGFDEYVVGYKQRNLFLPVEHTRKVITVNGLFNPTIVIDGQVKGTWSRVIKKDKVIVELHPFKTLTKTEKERVAGKVKEYGKFIGKEVETK